MAKSIPTAELASSPDRAATLPVSEAVRHAAPAVAAELEAIVQRREAHQQPVFRMDKSLVNTAPPPLAQELMEGKKTSRYSAWEVGPAAGVIELRQEIASWRRNLYRERITSDNVLITPGASAAFYLTLTSLVRPGEGVITLPPCFPNYVGALRVHGAEVSNVRLQPENDFAPSHAQLMNTWGPRTRMLICTLPNNPTGTTFNNSVVKSIEALARERGGRVVADETFAPFDLRPDAHATKDLSLQTTITLGSFSEAFSLADLRVGYIIAPKDLVQEMSMLQGYINVGASARAQEIAFAALRNREEHFSRLIPKLRARDADLCDALTRVPGVESVVGYAGTFKWIKTAAENSARLALDLARETGVIVRPGIDYGQEGWLRVAFGMIGSDSSFREAMNRLRSFKGWHKSSEWHSDLAVPERPRPKRAQPQAIP